MNGNPRTAAFKKRVAIEALKEERTINPEFTTTDLQKKVNRSA